jgi:hypothetical protein
VQHKTSCVQLWLSSKVPKIKLGIFQVYSFIVVDPEISIARYDAVYINALFISAIQQRPPGMINNSPELWYSQLIQPKYSLSIAACKAFDATSNMSKGGETYMTDSLDHFSMI